MPDPTLTTQHQIQLERIFSHKLLWCRDADELKIFGHGRTNVWKIRQLAQAITFDFGRIHGR